jgi:hypothetical protein
MNLFLRAWQSDLLDRTLRGGRVDPKDAVSIDPEHDLTLGIEVLHQVRTVLALKLSCDRCCGLLLMLLPCRCARPVCFDLEPRRTRLYLEHFHT